MQHRTREAFESLDTVQRLEPLGRETRNAERVLRTILASTADPRVSFYSDSDQLQVLRVEPRASAVFPSGTRVSGGYERHAVWTPRIGSGLEQTGRIAVGAASSTSGSGAAQKIGLLTVGGAVGYATARPLARRRPTTWALSSSRSTACASLPNVDRIFRRSRREPSVSA